MEVATHDFVPCYAGQFGRSHLPYQSDRSPPYPIWASTWLTLCIAFSMEEPSLVVGLPLSVARESSHRRSPPLSLSIPTYPSGSKVGKSSEEREYLDDVDYHQLLKDYSKVQVLFSSSMLNAEMLHGELDAMHDALQVSENEAS